MFKQLSTKELKEIYADRPWINKNAITNLFLSAFAETVIPAMDKAMALAIKYDAVDIDDRMVMMYQTRLWLATGNLDSARDWAATFALEKPDDLEAKDHQDFIDYRQVPFDETFRFLSSELNENDTVHFIVGPPGNIRFYRRKYDAQFNIVTRYNFDSIEEIIIYMNDTKSFYLVLPDYVFIADKINEETLKHPYAIKRTGSRGETSFSYQFHLSGDDKKKVFMEVIALHFAGL